jgi:hypothetical protein
MGSLAKDHRCHKAAGSEFKFPKSHIESMNAIEFSSVVKDKSMVNPISCLTDNLDSSPMHRFGCKWVGAKGGSTPRVT